MRSFFSPRPGRTFSFVLPATHLRKTPLHFSVNIGASLLTAAAFFVSVQTYGQCTAVNINVTANDLVVNTYYPATTSVAAKGYAITLGAARGAATPIAKGDLLLVIQMQGATINTANDLSYGDGGAGGAAAGYLTATAGTYQYAVAANNVALGGGTLYLTKGTVYAFTNSDAGVTGAYRYQVIRVPRYANVSFNNNREILGIPWNGTSGGVVVLDASGAFTVRPNCVLANGMGFRGGAGRQLSGGGGYTNADVVAGPTGAHASKGEGIAGTPQHVVDAAGTAVISAATDTYPGGSNAAGAPGNAGGGATDGRPVSNDENAGGGGGGNGGAGGRGGKSWNSNLSIGGWGGVSPAFLASSRLIMGGGGGAGSTNDGTGSTPAGISSSGGAGGGIIIIRAGAFAGTGSISASGQNGQSPSNDGGGGAGAGGTIYLTASNPAGLTNVTVDARGGNGGNAWSGQADNGTLDDGNPEHGPGGGGGGGIIYANGAINALSTAAGGVNGTTLTNTQAFGATTGGNGQVITNVAPLTVKTSELCDADDDNDGLPDALEYTSGVDVYADADGDNIPNVYDNAPGAGVPAFADANSDGLSDAFDNDRDGIMDALDLDADGDGIPDLTEAGGVDSNGDGLVDVLTDSDGDGLPDKYDTSVGGGVAIANLDTDGDGIPNYKDLDSDNDGIPDVVEAAGTDADNNGQLDALADADFDGFADVVDGDANDDGTAENTAASLLPTGADGNADGRPDNCTSSNTDRIGLPNPYDLDADGDGILDVREAGLADANNDGIADGTLGTDGWSDAVDALVALNPPNTDGRGGANYLDIDADDDGLTDNVEGQPTASYQLPAGSDGDGDGIDDNYDNNDALFGGASGNGINPYNHDGSDVPDYLDLDSDNDGAADLREGSGNGAATLTNTADGDGDGLVDQFDVFNLNMPPGALHFNVTIAGMGSGGSAAGPANPGSSYAATQTGAGQPNRDWRNNLFVLPVRLLSFTVQQQADKVLLTWTTANEVRFKGFTVERSIDGRSFTAVGFVPAQGGVTNQYSFNDLLTNVQADKVFYRLKQVDTDGSFAYSPVLTLALKTTDNNIRLLISPNPVRAGAPLGLQMQLPQAARLQVQLVDASGKHISLGVLTLQRGTSKMRLYTPGSLAAGVYTLVLADGAQVYTQKLLIQ